MRLRQIRPRYAFAALFVIACSAEIELIATDASTSDETKVTSSPTPIYVLPPVLAFPTAEGFGAGARGGRGGRVVFVTNLADSGVGSLRDALSGSQGTGPRIVVFRVSGTIALSSNILLREANSFVTVAGQSAPGDGVQLKNYGIDIREGAHDVIIRHLRVRPGLDKATSTGTQFFPGIALWGSNGKNVYNVMIDHSSVEWCSDESTSAWDWTTRSTIQWSIIGEGMSPTAYPYNAGAYGKGLITGGAANGDKLQLSVHHNLFAHTMGRNPYLQRADVIDFVNNVIYNWPCNNAISVGSACILNTGNTYGAKANFVNNHYIRGPLSTCVDLAFLEGKTINGITTSQLYVKGNWGPYCPTGCTDDWNFHFTELRYPNCYPGHYDTSGRYSLAAPPEKFRSSVRFNAPLVALTPTANLKSSVLADVGATRPMRDSLDARIVDSVRTLSNRGTYGTYPVLASAPALEDTDRDGMPNSWELAHGLSPTNASDGPLVAHNGYTNVENYLNELAGDSISCL